MDHHAVPGSVVAHMVEVRRDLQRHPELAFQEERTAARIIAELDAFGIAYDYRGVIGRLGPADAATTIALRPDMDALPGEETTGLPFASEEQGRMHACGHDAHVAMLLGAAHLLAADPPAVGVRRVFQPAPTRPPGSEGVWLVWRSGCRWHLGPGFQWDFPMGPGHLGRCSTAAGHTGVGLAPLAITPTHQGQGISAQLVTAGLEAIRHTRHHLAVVLGEPGYYGRFGIQSARVP